MFIDKLRCKSSETKLEKEEGVQVEDIFGIFGTTTTTKKTKDGVQVEDIFGLDPGSPTLSSQGVQVEDIFGLIPADEKTTKKVPTMPVQVDDIFGLISNYEKTTKRVPTLPDQILILPSTKSPPLDCGTDEYVSSKIKTKHD